MNIIWDLDGTIIDSYPVIVDSLYQISKSYGIHHTKETIYQFVKNNAVHDYLLFISKTIHQDINDLRKIFNHQSTTTP